MQKTVQLAVTFKAKSKTVEQVNEALECFYEYLDVFERGWDGEAQVDLFWHLAATKEE